MPALTHTSRPAVRSDRPAPGVPGAGGVGAYLTCQGAALALQRGADGAALPEWCALIAPGISHTRDGRGPYTLADAAAVVAAFGAHYPPGSDQDAPVDYAHADLLRAPGADFPPAAGWLTEVRCAADGGVEGRIEWTARAAAMIAAREVRYLSPELLVDPATLSIVGLSGAGLTHRPNLTLRALSEQARPHLEPQMDDDILERLRYLLNLPTLATPADIAAQLTVLTDRLKAATGAAEDAGLVTASASPADTLVLLYATGRHVAAMRTLCDTGPGVPTATVLSTAQTRIRDLTAEASGYAAALHMLRTDLGLVAADGGARLQPGDIAAQTIARVRTLETAAAEREASELVAQAMRDRLIAPAQQVWAQGYARQDPQAFRSYLKGCTPILGTATTRTPPTGDPAGSDYEALVTQAMTADKCTRGTAMMAVARDHPEAHRAWIDSTQPQAQRA